MFSPWSVRLLVCPWTGSRKELYSIFMKPYTIMYPCYRKNPLIFRVDPTQVGRLAAVWYFYYNMLAMCRFVPTFYCRLCGGMLSTKNLPVVIVILVQFRFNIFR